MAPPDKSEAPCRVGGTGLAATATADPLYEVDVGGGGHPPARHGDVAARPGHNPGGDQRSWKCICRLTGKVFLEVNLEVFI